MTKLPHRPRVTRRISDRQLERSKRQDPFPELNKYRDPHHHEERVDGRRLVVKDRGLQNAMTSSEERTSVEAEGYRISVLEQILSC